MMSTLSAFDNHGENTVSDNIIEELAKIDEWLNVKKSKFMLFHMPCNKISRTVGLINRLKNYIPENALLTIYNTLIIPHLNYGILTWGFNSDRIMKIQKKAVRSITSSKYNAHTEPIFKTLKLLKINDIFKCQTLKFCYKLINGNLPVYFNQGDWYSPISNIYCYNTRRQHKLFIYRKNHEFAKRCLRHEVVITFNNTLWVYWIKYIHTL